MTKTRASTTEQATGTGTGKATEAATAAPGSPAELTLWDLVSEYTRAPDLYVGQLYASEARPDGRWGAVLPRLSLDALDDIDERAMTLYAETYPVTVVLRLRRRDGIWAQQGVLRLPPRRSAVVVSADGSAAPQAAPGFAGGDLASVINLAVSSALARVAPTTAPADPFAVFERVFSLVRQVGAPGGVAPAASSLDDVKRAIDLGKEMAQQSSGRTDWAGIVSAAVPVINTLTDRVATMVEKVAEKQAEVLVAQANARGEGNDGDDDDDDEAGDAR